MPKFTIKVDFYKGTEEEYEYLHHSLTKEGFEQIIDLNHEPTRWYLVSGGDDDLEVHAISLAVEKAILDTAAKFYRKFSKDYYTIVTPSITLKFKLKELLKHSPSKSEAAESTENFDEWLSNKPLLNSGSA